MSSVGEAVGALALVAAIGTALVVLPPPESETQTLPITIERQPTLVLRAEPLEPKSNAERVEDLQNELGAIAAEHRRLTEQVKAMTTKDRSFREGARKKK